MQIPVRVAWCPLLWTSNGGKLREDGMPVLSSYETEVDPDGGEATWVKARRGYCDRAYDCNECFLLQKFVEEERGKGVRDTWECKTCAFTPSPGELRAVPGYYTSEISNQAGDPRCARCGEESPFLQLVLRMNECQAGHTEG